MGSVCHGSIRFNDDDNLNDGKTRKEESYPLQCDGYKLDNSIMGGAGSGFGVVHAAKCLTNNTSLFSYIGSLHSPRNSSIQLITITLLFFSKASCTKFLSSSFSVHMVSITVTVSDEKVLYTCEARPHVV